MRFEQQPVVPRLFGNFQAQGNALSGLLSGTTPVPAAAERFASSELAKKDAKRRVWKLFFDTAADFPEKHSVLVEFYLALQDMARHRSGEKGLAARDFIGSFETHWRAAHDMFWLKRNGEGIKWVTFNAFSARLLGARSNMVLIMYGFMTLRNLLETIRPHNAAGLRETPDSLKHCYEPIEEDISLYLCAATQWILHSGRTIYEAENSMVPEAWARRLTERTDYWNYRSGFSKERWNIWKLQLWCTSKRKTLAKLAKSAACKAVAEMIRIERAPVVAYRGTDVMDFAKASPVVKRSAGRKLNRGLYSIVEEREPL
ncbi:MAG: hypothetical protein M1816_007686 [Peltula sp. TS41687]|nr:MAG: hypothetical protein M1816_007686 [Peltula sp. TS41687]